MGDDYNVRYLFTVIVDHFAGMFLKSAPVCEMSEGTLFQRQCEMSKGSEWHLDLFAEYAGAALTLTVKWPDGSLSEVYY